MTHVFCTGSVCSSVDGIDNPPQSITEHFINTMAVPYLMNRTHTVS